MSEPSDSTAVRTAGLVLCGIGVLTCFAALAWNGMGDYPDEGSLVSTEGTVERAEVREISTRTSLKHWDVIEVITTSEQGSESARWVFPEHDELFDTVVTGLEVGDTVSARVKPVVERLRWSEAPVRIVWSLSKSDRELVSYAQIIGVLDAARYQSPVAGFMVVGVGIALVLVSRIRFERVPDPSQ